MEQKTFLKRAKQFYRDNETAINVGMLFIPGVGLLGQGAKYGIQYALRAQKATDTFKTINKMPKLKFIKQPKGTSITWLAKNRSNTKKRFAKNVNVYKQKYKQYRKEQADLAHRDMKKMTLYTGTGLALSGAGVYQAGKIKDNR